MVPIDHIVVIDIETVSRCASFEQMNAHWQELWDKKTAKLRDQDTTAAAFFQERAAIYAEFGKIICISAGYYRQLGGRQVLRVKSYSGHQEADILKTFVDDMNAWQVSKQNPPVFAGHNIKEFDIPYISRRLLVNGMPIPPWMDFMAMKPWETNLIDTLHMWRFGDFKNYTSLNLIAACLGIESPKDDIDGSMVGTVYWQEQNLPRIVEYCQKDVFTVAQLLLRFRHLPLMDAHAMELV
jgi:uncharacterized protein YprB with RNaseH-like and TPR domain